MGAYAKKSGHVKVLYNFGECETMHKINKKKIKYL